MTRQHTAPHRTEHPRQASSEVLLTRAGLKGLRRKAAALRSDSLPEVRAALAERNRDGRVDLEYHRLCDEISRLEDLVLTAGSTRDRPRGGRE